jgi:hypothetical protein
MVELTPEGIKEAIKDRFRVIEIKDAGAASIQDQLNRYGDQGYGISLVLEGIIIMHRVVNLDMPNGMASPDSWEVPGAQGSA